MTILTLFQGFGDRPWLPWPCIQTILTLFDNFTSKLLSFPLRLNFIGKINWQHILLVIDNWSIQCVITLKGTLQIIFTALLYPICRNCPLDAVLSSAHYTGVGCIFTRAISPKSSFLSHGRYTLLYSNICFDFAKPLSSCFAIICFRQDFFFFPGSARGGKMRRTSLGEEASG